MNQNPNPHQNDSLSPSARRVQAALDGLGLELQVVELPGSTRTAREAAEAIGCSVAQIVKSLIFKMAETGSPLLVIASGANRVSETRVTGIIGEAITRASPDFVRRETGFAIGGVPPVGHIKPLQTLIDEDLLQQDIIWAAAGTPHAVFRLTPQDLVRLCGDAIVSVT